MMFSKLWDLLTPSPGEVPLTQLNINIGSFWWGCGWVSYKYRTWRCQQSSQGCEIPPALSAVFPAPFRGFVTPVAALLVPVANEAPRKTLGGVALAGEVAHVAVGCVQRHLKRQVVILAETR